MSENINKGIKDTSGYQPQNEVRGYQPLNEGYQPLTSKKEPSTPPSTGSPVTKPKSNK